jgi:uncharacterized repeat protein (TIGR03803 family)
MALSRLALFAILAVGIAGVVRPAPPPASLTSTEDLLWSFRGNLFDDGANPLGALLAGKRGALYGTTNQGGEYGRGTVFRLDTMKTKAPIGSLR